MQTNESDLEELEVNYHKINLIAVVLATKRLAKLTGKPQLKIQESIFLKAIHFSLNSSNEEVEQFLKSHFPNEEVKTVDINEPDEEIGTTEVDSLDLAAIGFVILASKMAKLTKTDQVKVQKDALLEAFQLYKVSSPESLECFLRVNFPLIKEVIKHEG